MEGVVDDLTSRQQIVFNAVKKDRLGVFSHELLDRTGMHPKSQGGVIASLVRKGILKTEIDQNGTFVMLTALGDALEVK